MAMTRGNGLSLSINTDLDMSPAQKTYRELQNNVSRKKLNIPLDIKIDDIVPKLDNILNKKIGRVVDDSFNKINTKFQNVTRTIKKELEDGSIQNVTEHLTKVTETFKNNIGDVQERVSFWGENNEYLASSLKNVQKGIVDISTETNTYYKQIGNLAGKVTEVTKTLTDSSGAEKKVITTTTEWIDQQGKLNQSITVTNEKGEQLSAVTKTITDDTKKATKLMNEFANATKKVAQSSDGVDRTETKTWIDKNGVKTVEQYKNGMLQLTTITREYINDNKELVVEVQKLEGEERKLVSVNTQKKRDLQEENRLLNENIDATFKARQEKERLAEAERKAQEQIERGLVSTTSTSFKTTTTQFGDTSGQQYEALAKQIIKVDEAGKKTITTIYEFENAQKQLVRQTRITDENNKKLAQDTIQVSDAENKVSDSARRATTETNKYGESTRRAAVETKTFGQKLSDAIARLARYYVASLPIQIVRRTISETITTVKEFDSALIEFRKVSDLAGDSLTRYVAKLAEMGEVTGSTMQAMVEASTEFRKSGFSDEDSAKLASIAEKYRNIADEEISAGESASFIIAQMKAFNIEADQAEHIIDAVNEVANNFSVSSADLAQNLGNMSAIMALNNVSMEEQIGLLTGVTEITRKASSASRGLVMISSRLTQVLDDTSSTGKKLTKIYEDLGIELKDENGQLRSHYEILSDLAKQWNNLSENQQKYIALTSAGARQQQNFSAMMQNWNNVVEATTSAYNSMGSAQRENEKVMDSITKKTEILRSQFQQLVIGKGGLQDFAKNILDVGIKLVKFANSDLGKFTLALIAVETATISLIKNWKSLIVAFENTKIVILIKELIALRNGTMVNITTTFALKVAQEGLARALWETVAAMMAAGGWIAAAVAAVSAIIYATYEYTKRLDNAVESLQELSDASQQTQSEVENLKNALEQINIQLDNLNEKKLSITDDKELEKLEKQTQELKKQEDSLKRQLALQLSLLENQYKEETEAARKVLDTTTQSQFETERVASATMMSDFGGWGTSSTSVAPRNVLPTRELELARDKYKELQNQIDSLNQVLIVEEQQGRINGEVYTSVSQKITDLEASQSKVVERGNEMANIVQTSTDSLHDQDEATQQLKTDNYALLDSYYKTTGVMQQVEDSIDNTTQSAEELAEEEDKLAEIVDEFSESLGVSFLEAQDILSDFADEMGSSIEEASDLLKKFAKNLGISERELIANAEAMYMSIDTYYEYAMGVKATQEALKNTSSTIDGLQDALNKAKTALEEYNEKGYLTLDTFQDLMSVSAQYLTSLVNEEGQLEINQETLGNLVEVLKQEKVEELQAAEIADILAYAHGDVEHMSGLAKTALEKAGNAAKESGDKAAQGSAGYWSMAEAAAAAAAADGSIDVSHIEANIQRIHNAYAQAAKSVYSITVNTTAAGNAASKAGKKGAGAAKEATDATKELNKELEETKSKYEKVISFITGRIDKQTKAIQKQKDAEVDAIEKIIKAREKQKDKELDAIEEQINALEKEKDAREKYWDDQIDALKKANDERKDALELQEKLDALEKAKNTKVKIYKEGQGFVYDVDQTAVAEAQQALDEYLSEKAYEDELARLEALKDAEVNNYDQRLDALNQYKDNVQKSYEDQIAALEAQREALEEQYDAQIEYYNNFKEQFEDMVKAYEDKQTELLASQLTGINFENNNWMTRLDNLAKFVNEYNRLQEQLNTGNTNTSNTATMSSGGGLPSNNSGTKKSANIGGGSATKGNTQGGAGSQSGSAGLQLSALSANRKRVLGYASGTPSVKDNEIAIVGENPNQEIVIGSKINNGELMSLEKGTGVVNADSSKTIAGLLNQVGQFGASGFGSGNGTLSNINNDSLTINGVTIQGANIKDPETFVNGLLNLKAEALQRAYRHR